MFHVSHLSVFFISPTFNYFSSLPPFQYFSSLPPLIFSSLPPKIIFHLSHLSVFFISPTFDYFSSLPSLVFFISPTFKYCFRKTNESGRLPARYHCRIRPPISPNPKLKRKTKNVSFAEKAPLTPLYLLAAVISQRQPLGTTGDHQEPTYTASSRQLETKNQR